MFILDELNARDSQILLGHPSIVSTHISPPDVAFDLWVNQSLQVLTYRDIFCDQIKKFTCLFVYIDRADREFQAMTVYSDATESEGELVP